jgi:hypothetical protein
MRGIQSVVVIEGETEAGVVESFPRFTESDKKALFAFQRPPLCLEPPFSNSANPLERNPFVFAPQEGRGAGAVYDFGRTPGVGKFGRSWEGS